MDLGYLFLVKLNKNLIYHASLHILYKWAQRTRSVHETVVSKPTQIATQILNMSEVTYLLCLSISSKISLIVDVTMKDDVFLWMEEDGTRVLGHYDLLHN